MLLLHWLLSFAVFMATTSAGAGNRRRRVRQGRDDGERSRTSASLLREDPDAEDCMTVQQQCASRLGCSIALSNYMLSCGPVVQGDTRGHVGCTLECHNALVTLLSMDDRQGEVFMTCRCNGNEICEEQKRRLEVCHEEVIGAVPAVMDNLTDISCTLAQLICSADTSCYTALNYYNRHCQKLIRGEKCSSKCNNSLSILYKQRKARKLRTCICDGSEMYNCEELRSNTETMCRHHPFATGTTEHVRHHHDHARTRTSTLPPDSTRGWGQGGGWVDWEEDYEDEREGEEEEAREREKEKEAEKNYTGRHRKNLTSAESAASSHTVASGYCSIVLSYYLTTCLILYPVLKSSTSPFLVLL